MAESKNSIRSGLKRLFSSEVIVRSSDGKNIKTADLNGNQAISQDMTGMYNGLYASGNNHSMSSGYGPQGQEYGFQASRINLFRSYEQMDTDPIISSALDVYANESSTKDAYGNIVDVKCENGEVKNVLENLLFDILNVNYNSRWWARSIAKYGDLFLHLTVNEGVGVTNVTPLSAYEVMRVENPQENITQFYYDVNQNTSYGSQSNQAVFEEWEVAHFRFKNDGNFLPYGKSIIENGRKIWKQLSLMEEAMLIHRIMRAPEKRVFKIDVGNIEPDAIESHMNDVMNTIQQTPLIDPETGQYNLEFNMMNMLEDFFLPVRGNTSGTEIQSLQGLQYQAMEDVEYLRKKLMSALKVPNAFLGYEQEIQGKCLHPDTEIELLSGKSMRVEDIAKEYEDNEHETLWTYSYDFEEDEVVPGKIVEAQKTRENAEIVEVELDNGTSVKTTPDHSFILKDGTEVNAENLTEGDSLKSFEKRTKKIRSNALEYEQVFHNEDKGWQWTHKMVDEYFNGVIKNNGYLENGKFDRDSLTVVHHEDFDRYNNRPDNLRRMRWDDHRDLHNECLSDEWKDQWGTRSELNKTDEYREWASKRTKQWIEDNPEYRNRLRDQWLDMTPEERSEVVKKGWTEERKEHRIEKNKKMNLAEKMLQARIHNDFENTLSGEDHPRYRKRPQFNKIVSFIESYEGDKEDIRTIFKLAKKMGMSKSIIQETIEDNGYTCTTFMNEYWGFKRGRSKDMHADHFHRLSVSSENLKDFMNKCGITCYSVCKKIVQRHTDDYEEWKENTLGSCYNHKVVSVKLLTEKVDTYNIEVKDRNGNHNYAINSGIFIKNSTLAQESIKFAQAVSTLQQTIARELKKIAVVHLYVRGYRGADLIDFDFEFTNPSIVAEQERIEFLSRKIQLARDMKDLPFHSSETIMKEIFNMSDEEIEENRKGKIRDYKREFRKEQITREGNDPIKTGRSYGTPADLAASGGSDLQHLDVDELQDEIGNIEDEEPTSDIDGVNDMQDLSQDIRPKGSDIKHKYQGGSPNALSASFKDSLRNRRKSLIQEATTKKDAIFESIVKKEEKEDYSEFDDESFMSESILNMSEETLDMVEEFIENQKS